MGAPAFAIYLNANARRVSPDVVARIEELVHPDDIYFSTCLEDAGRHAARIIEKGYPTVFTGGGDGTVCQFINALYREARRASRRADLPTLGVLALGTGNALSRLVSSGNAIQDLKSYLTNPSSDVWTLPLVECEGHLFPFGGAGIDGEILADYEALKARIGDGPLKPIFRNVGGYFLAFFTRTGPRRVVDMLRGWRLQVRVTNLVGQAYEAGDEGQRVRAFRAGEVIYEGPASAVLAGTIPVIGYGARVLPLADRERGHFSLRVATIGLARALVSLPELWHGTYRGEGIRDFFARKVKVDFSEHMPFQAAGDLVGRRDSLTLRLVPDAVRLLRFF